MSALNSVRKGLVQLSPFSVEADLSGGAKFALGDKNFVLAPREAAKAAVGIFVAIGAKVEHVGPGRLVIEVKP